MLNISKQQATQRYAIILPILKEALFSGESANELYYISKENQLDDKQMGDLSIIVGDIILGFLSLDDLQREIKNNLKLDDIKARTIEREINQKVFAHLRGDLEKNYNPVLPEEEKIMAPTAPAQIPSRPIVQGGMMPHVPMQKSFRDFIKRKPGESIPEAPTSASRQSSEQEKELKPVIDLSSFEIKGTTPKTAPAETITPKMEAPAEPMTPFILHQHDQQEILQSPIKKFSIKPELNVKVENYYQAPEPKKSAISARVELPQNQIINEQSRRPNGVRTPTGVSELTINNSKTRIVHYDGYSTPLNSAGLPKTEENKINLSSLTKLFSSLEKTALPLLIAEQTLRQNSGQVRTQEIPKENKVDLRKFSKSDDNAIDLRSKHK